MNHYFGQFWNRFVKSQRRPHARRQFALTAYSEAALSMEVLEDRALLSGDFALAQAIGGPGYDRADAVATDADGNVYMAGDFSGTVDFDPGPGTTNLTSELARDMFLAKYDSTGGLIWALRTGGMQQAALNNPYQSADPHIAFDATGNVYVAGAFAADPSVDGSVADFDPGPDQRLITSSNLTGLTDVFVAKFDSDGNFIWANAYKHPGEIHEDYVGGLDVDGSGNIVFAVRGANPQVRKIEPTSGTVVWTKLFPGRASFGDLDIDGSGNVYVVGGFENQVDFDPGPGILPLTSAGQTDNFLMKLDTNGNLDWVKQIGGPGFDGANAVSLDNLGHVWIAGFFDGSVPVDFDPGMGTVDLVGSGLSAYLLKLDTSGNFGLARVMAIGAPSYGFNRTEAFGVAVETTGDVIVVGGGQARVPVDLDPGPAEFLITPLTDRGFGFISSVDQNGNLNWAGGLLMSAAVSGASAQAVTTDTAGNVYVVGGYDGTVDFDPGTETHNLSSDSGSLDAFLVKFAADVVPVTPGNIQDIIDNLDTGTTTEVQAPAAPGDINDWLEAVALLTPSTTGPIIDIVLNLQNGTFGLGRTVDVPVGYRLIINGAAGSVIIEGSSPALTLASGDLLVLNGVTLVNSTDAPTIQVTGGSLVLRDSIVRETTGGSQAAIEINGGSVDLGTADNLGGNSIDVSGPGELIRNLSSTFVPAAGNLYQVDGSTLTSGFAIEDEVFHGLDVAGLGIVDFGDGSLFVVAGGDLQRAIVAAPTDATIHVAPGITQNYAVGAKLLTVAFENGPTISQHADSLNSALRALTIIGTPVDDVITFTRGPAEGEVQAEVSGAPTGSFLPTGRLLAFGEAGNDDISVDGSIGLNAVLNGGMGHDRLKGGAGHDNLLGDDGDDLLVGGNGRDLLIGGLGADRLVGNAEEDILIAGTTTFDAHDLALAAIMAEWTSSRSYAERTANIGGGSGASGARLNSNYFLNWSAENGPITVFDDNEKDMLTGSAGQDWFFANLFLDNGDDADQKDKITDLNASEFAADLDFIGVE